MKINNSKNIWLTVFYLVFLVMVFLLFGIIRNSGQNMPAVTYIALFVIVFLGGLMYSQAYKRGISRVAELTHLPEQQQIESQVDDEKTEIDENTSDEIIDSKKLLPKEKVNPEKFGEELLQNFAQEFQICQGLFYIKDVADDTYKCFSQYAYFSDRPPVSFKSGETLPGQAVKNKNIVTLTDIPDKYMTIASGLGESSPRYLTFVPLLNRDEVTGLIEFASFKPMTPALEKALKQLAEKVGDTITKMIKK